MKEDLEIENIKDGCKISVPIISNQELDDFNNILDIETEYEKLIKKASEQVYKERECILLQQIIKKQERTIENLIARNKELEKQVNEYEKQLDLDYVDTNYIPKSKVREKIEEVIQNSSKFNCLSPLNYNDEYNATRYAVTKLQELLQEGDK